MRKRKCGRLYEVQCEERHQKKRLSELQSKHILSGFKAVTTAHAIPHVNNARGNYQCVCNARSNKTHANNAKCYKPYAHVMQAVVKFLPKIQDKR